MKVTAFVGSARKRHTYEATRRFLENLEALGGVESELVVLSEYGIGTCRGCMLCFDRGEEFCPMKDDRDVLIEKMMVSDGVVFASPNYSFQVSAILKIFLDRLGFVCHRPRFFGKTFTCVVAQGIHGGGKIVKYLDFFAHSIGFRRVKGCVVKAMEPVNPKARRHNETALAALSRRFHARLRRPPFSAPTVLDLMIFRMARMSVSRMLPDHSPDHSYYREKGWLDSDFYYPTRLNPLKKAAGAIFDWVGARIFKRHTETSAGAGNAS